MLLLKNACKDLLKLGTNASYGIPTKCCYFFKWIRNPIWPPRPLIGWYIFHFFSRSAEEIYSKLSTNISYGVLTKCCCFLSGSEIQYGRPEPLFGWDISKFFSIKAAGIYSKLSTNVPYGVPTNCCCLLSGSEVKYPDSGLWLTDISTSSPERPQGSTPMLVQMFLMGSRPSVITF